MTENPTPQPEPEQPGQDPDATAPSDPATPDDPDNGDPHAEPEAPGVQVNGDQADVTVNPEPDADAEDE